MVLDNLENREFITTKKSGKDWHEIFESKEFEEKYNEEFNDKLITADELAKREKHFKEFKEQSQANKENDK